MHMPDSTTKWMGVRSRVFRVFKVRRLKVPVERIPRPYHVAGMDVDTWLMGQDHFIKEELLSFQNYFRDSLDPIDIDRIDWFYDSKGHEIKETDLESRLQSLMLQLVKCTSNAKLRSKRNRFITRMENALDGWVAKLGSILKTCPSQLKESAYKDIFGAFVELFGLKCWPGNREKMEIPYKVFGADGQGAVTGVKSAPDLIMYRHEYLRGFASVKPLAVVDVKTPHGFTAKKRHRLAKRSRKRALSVEERERCEEQQGNKKREVDSPEMCVKCVEKRSVEVAPATSSVLSSTICVASSDQPTTTQTQPQNQGSSPQEPSGANETYMYEEVDYSELPPCAEIPSAEEERSWNDFLPQLLGDIVAAGYLQCDTIYTKNSSLGIAVRGYCVTFLNFACQGNFHFDDIPLKAGASMDIFISEPLSILKKEDREKIFKILLYLVI